MVFMIKSDLFLHIVFNRQIQLTSVTMNELGLNFKQARLKRAKKYKIIILKM